MLRIFIFLGMFCLITSCNNEPTNTPPPAAPITAPVAKSQPTGEQLYPSVDGKVIEELWETSTGVDYIYYNFNFSMNRSQQNDIRNSLIHISNTPALIRKDCKPIGRIMFKDDNGIRLEADMFFSKNCSYFVFMEDNKPKYANFMSNEGIKFFNNVFTKMNISIE